MTEYMNVPLDIFSINDAKDVKAATDSLFAGQLSLLRVGSVFSFVLNPYIHGLVDNLNRLKERGKEQFMSIVCTYEQALSLVDTSRVNEDFYNINPFVCSNALIRFPIDTTKDIPFIYNEADGTVQFISFENTNPLRREYKNILYDAGCQYISITSGNVHNAPTIENIHDAKLLAAFMNIKAEFLGIPHQKTTITDIPDDHSLHKGSYIVLSFCNKEQVEIKRLANKGDAALTKNVLPILLKDVVFKTKLVYDI